MSSIHEKIKVLILGDSGVGKSSLLELLCHGQAVGNPQWTIGCSIDVKLHQYKEGTAAQRTCYIELWEVGGSRSHAIARKIFFNSFDGIILVQDLTNGKSEHNLKNWLGKALAVESDMKDQKTSVLDSATISQALFPVSSDLDYEYDPESFIGCNQIPVLIAATKLDQIPDSEIVESGKHHLADSLKCDLIYVNARNSKSIQPGSTNAVKVSRFFDKVAEKKFKHSMAHQGVGNAGNYGSTSLQQRNNSQQQQQQYWFNNMLFNNQ